jgi:hypothetical protein
VSSGELREASSKKEQADMETNAYTQIEKKQNKATEAIINI